MNSGINAVISESALSLHTEYLKTLRLKYSVLEKSYPGIVGKSPAQIAKIPKMRISEREEAVLLASEIKLHELYFSSFGAGYQSSKSVKAAYGSEANFLYELFECAKNVKSGYAMIYVRNGRVAFDAGDCELFLKIQNPILCVDLYEHAYFSDYGFMRESYLRALLPYLNISIADKFLLYKD